MHRVAGRLALVLVLVANRVSVIVMILIGVMDHYPICGIDMASVVRVTVRHGRAHAPVREEHDAKHEDGEPLSHSGRLTPRAATNNRNNASIGSSLIERPDDSTQ
ncbi:hypothetical protein [Sphingomonas solaris]|uniref:Uncharacterized protein n=1 Tax=Alterirhizorhabdus solaris TaxID=2529389 RepID=A0A558RDE5_9SPHN|nr:hypothetical protein [Sphingomonas solaris]TVV77406.1 hypothetical protein FOY91_01240 [Sphingomonas solaris]